jgi:hypothetical protein
MRGSSYMTALRSFSAIAGYGSTVDGIALARSDECDISTSIGS